MHQQPGIGQRIATIASKVFPSSQYDWGEPIPGIGPGLNGKPIEFNADGTRDLDGNGTLDIDCSNLVNQVLNLAGFCIPYLPTQALFDPNKRSKYFDVIATETTGKDKIQAGDIILFNTFNDPTGNSRGHAAIVTAYNSATQSGTFFGAQTSGIGERQFKTDNQNGTGYWGETGFTNAQPGQTPQPKKEFVLVLRPKHIPPGECKWIEDTKAIIQSAIATGPPKYDPLILDLDGNGIPTVGVTGGAFFDYDGDGFAEQTGWVAPGDGMLVLDRNGDGIINNGSELIGSFQALANLDDNHDGKIDANDAAFVNLRVWRDLEHWNDDEGEGINVGDGVSQPDELLTLSEAGIQSLSTASTATNALPSTDPNVNTETRKGSFTRIDGTASEIGEFLLKLDPTESLPQQILV